MPRPWRLFVFVAVLLSASDARAQTRPSLLYSLPEDGTWVEYEVKGTTPSKQALAGFLRVASVGTKEVNKVKHRWIEVKIDTKKGAQRNIEIFIHREIVDEVIALEHESDVFLVDLDALLRVHLVNGLIREVEFTSP